jgi:hypothetical protein
MSPKVSLLEKPKWCGQGGREALALVLALVMALALVLVVVPGMVLAVVVVSVLVTSGVEV